MGDESGLAEPPPLPDGALHVTAALIVRAGRVLLARRVRPPELRGLWEFPGGKVERGEAPRAALARELVEELDVVVRVGDFVARSVDSARARALVLDAYLCLALRGEPRPLPGDGTHDATRWVDGVELADLVREGALAPLDVPLADALGPVLAGPSAG